MMTYSLAKVILRRNIEAFHMQTVKLKAKDRLEARLLLTVLTANTNTTKRWCNKQIVMINLESLGLSTSIQPFIQILTF